MIKLFYYVFLILAAALFAMTLLFSPYQEVLFQWWPNQEPLVVSMSTLAFFYCGFGLFVAIVLGLVDRMALMVRLKRAEKEKNALLAHSNKLKTILAEEPTAAVEENQAVSSSTGFDPS